MILTGKTKTSTIPSWTLVLALLKQVVIAAIKLSENNIGLSESIVHPERLLYPSITVCVRTDEEAARFGGELRNRFISASYFSPEHDKRLINARAITWTERAFTWGLTRQSHH